MTPEQIEGYLEDLENLREARTEYLERVKALQDLNGAEFETAANTLEAWVAEVNEDLNDFAQDELGEALAIDAESLAMLRLIRGGSAQ